MTTFEHDKIWNDHINNQSLKITGSDTYNRVTSTGGSPSDNIPVKTAFTFQVGSQKKPYTIVKKHGFFTDSFELYVGSAKQDDISKKTMQKIFNYLQNVNKYTKFTEGIKKSRTKVLSKLSKTRTRQLVKAAKANHK